MSALIVHMLQGRIRFVWEVPILCWASKLWHRNNTFQVLFFQLYLNKKYVEVALNAFTIHIIISK